MAQLRYVALGDSTSVGHGARSGGGYPHRLYRRFQDEGGVGRLFHFGVSGARVADVLAGQLTQAVAAKPSLLTLGIGVNDLWRGTGTGSFAEALEQIALGLSKTGATVIASNLPDLSLAPIAKTVPREWYEGRVGPFNAEVSAVGARHGWTVVDIFHASRSFLPGHPEYFCEDGFHPSDLGYERWTQELWPVFRTAALGFASATE